MDNLITMKDKLGNKYPNTIKSLEYNWYKLSKLVAFNSNIRKIIYITNII